MSNGDAGEAKTAEDKQPQKKKQKLNDVDPRLERIVLAKEFPSWIIAIKSKAHMEHDHLRRSVVANIGTKMKR